jgi:ABC-type phosphate/phosphonate transport system substrate-binding protein
MAIVGTTPSYPGLPLITSKATSDAAMGILRTALGDLLASEEARPTLQALGVIGFETPDPGVYQRCVDMQKAAQALGYPTLA